MTMTERWLKMGCELEGAWKRDFRTIASEVEGAQGKTDSSVHSLSGYIGEITTKPNDNLDALIKDVKALHPHYTNHSAGLHVHASFSHINTSLLTSEDFYKFFRARWKEWGEKIQATKKYKASDIENFWDRFNEESDQARKYCKDKFIPGEQLSKSQHNDRYTQLNFVSYKKFKTIECRLLPMFSDPELTEMAIRELSDIYITFLNTYTMPSTEIVEQLTADGDTILDEDVSITPDTGLIEDTWVSSVGGLPDEADFFHIAGAEGLMLPWTTEIPGNNA